MGRLGNMLLRWVVVRFAKGKGLAQHMLKNPLRTRLWISVYGWEVLEELFYWINWFILLDLTPKPKKKEETEKIEKTETDDE
jgi:hypothetical protein